MGSSETVRTVQIAITGTSAQLQKALTDAGLVGDETSAKIGTSIDTATTKAGGAISKLGQTASNMGIPFAGALTTVGSKFDEADTKGQKFGQSMSTLGGATLLAGAAGFAVVGAASIKAAGNFQTAMTQLVTGAGESKANIDLVSNGILNMAGKTGTSADVLAKGMFTVESAGYHGAAGLQVLQVAAEGAKVGGADLSTVTDAVTSALNAYGLKGKDATSVMNELVATVASGKMHMQDLAGALSAVTPTAAAAHISLSEVGGAIATMTAQGTSAQQAAQDLANTIRSLQNPSQTQIGEMEQLGLNANTVSTQLGQRGLSGTLSILVSTITSQMGPAGTVLLNTFKQSQSAGEDAKKMIGAMPASLQTLATAFLNGTVTQSQWRADMKALPVDQRELATQFAATANASRGFNDTLKSGSPQAQTFNAALSKVMGGSTGLSTALQLTGGHMGTFTSNVASVYNASTKTSGAVSGWSEVQKDFNFKLDQAKASAQALEIRFGNFLLPKITALMKAVEAVVGWFMKHKVAAEVLAGVIGGVLAAAIAVFAINTGTKMVKSIGSAMDSMKKLGSAAVDMVGKLLGVSAAEDAVGASGDAAGGGFDVAAAGAAALDAIPIVALIVGIVAAIALLVLGVIELIKHWSAVTAFFKKVWDDVKKVFDTAFGFIKAHLKDFIEGAIVIVTGGVGLIPVLIYRYWNQIESFTLNMISTVVNFFTQLPGRILGALSSVVSTIGGAFLGMATWIDTNAIEPVVNFFTALPGRIVSGLGSIVSTIWGALTQTVSWIDTNVIQPLLGFYIGIPLKIVAALGSIVSTIWGALLQSAVWVDTNVLQPVVSFFSGLPGRLVAGLGNIVGTIFGGLSGAWTWIKTNVYDPIISGFTGLPKDIAKAIGGAIGDLGSIATSIINAIIGGINAAINFYDDHRPSILGHSLLPFIPDIHPLASGGIVKASPGGTLALLAEAGQDEAVIPLGGGGSARRGIGSSAGTTNINNYITIANQDPQATVNALRTWMQRNGSLAGAGIN